MTKAPSLSSQTRHNTRPLSEADIDRVRWHLRAYDLIRQLGHGFITEDSIRKKIEACPEEYRDHFKHWLNQYRIKFKQSRGKAWQRKSQE